MNDAGTSGPHYLKREGPDGGVYGRVGSTNRGEAFDEQPMLALDSEALDFRAASESFASVRRIGRRDLEILRLVTDYHGHKALTGACREVGLGPPVFEEIGTRFRVTLTPRATRTRLSRLVAGGLVPEVGTGPQDPKRRYYRAE